MRKTSMKKRLMALLLSLTLVFALASTAGASYYPGYPSYPSTNTGTATVGIGQKTTLNSGFSDYLGDGLFRLVSVSWSSSNPGVVSINNSSPVGSISCDITGVSAGTATVTATGLYTVGGFDYTGTNGNAVSYTWIVTVGNFAPGTGTGTGTVTGNYASLSAGSMSFAAANSSSQLISVQSRYPGYNYTVTWSSSNPSVAQVYTLSGSSNYVVPKGNGSAIITAKVYSGNQQLDTLSCYVTVGYGGGTIPGGTIPGNYKSNLSTSSMTLAAPNQGSWNTSGQLTVTPANSWVTIKKVEWSSSDTRVATVTPYNYGTSTNGTTATVTAVGNGTATISATVTFSDNTTEGLGCNVTVGTGVNTGSTGSANGYYSTLSAGTLNLGTTGGITVGGVNNTSSLYVTAKTGYTITGVTWTSSNNNVVRVTPNYYTGTTYNVPTTATVTAVANGSATITATVTVSTGYYGQTYTDTLTCAVTVGTGTATGSANGYYSTLNAGTLNLGATGGITVGGANNTGSLYVTAKTGYTITGVTWTSSNNNVVRVTPNYYTGTTYNVPTTATVTAVANGSATITATVTVSTGYYGQTYTDTLTCAVTVGTGAAGTTGGITATVGLTERNFTLGSTNASTPSSIADQIAASVAGTTWPNVGRTLSYVVFTNVTSTYGSLNAQLNVPYYYNSYNNPNYWYTGLSTVTFTPAGFAGTASFSYTAYCTDNTTASGVINITVGQASGSADVIYSLTAGQTKALDVSDFTSFWTKANNNAAGTLSYIVLGNPTGNVGRLTYRNVTGQTVTGTSTPLYANPSYNQMGISSVSFAPNAVGSSYSTGILTVPFTAYGTTSNYGAAVTKSGTLAIVVTKNAVSAVKAQIASGKAVMKSSDFINVYKNATGNTTGTPVVTVQLLSLPAYGTLYSNYNAANKTGTALTNSNYAGMTFTSGVVNSYLTGASTSSLDSLTYIPGASNRADSFRYALYVNNVLQFQGTVEIKPLINVTFADVKTTDWFYKDVMALAQAGVVNGVVSGGVTKFNPQNKVTYGEALKMIMLAAGYTEQAPTSKHWASGYLTAAARDGLISSNVNLDAAIDRLTIATVAAKAMGISADNYTATPFTDTKDGYVVALYRIGIITGSKDSKGNKIYGTGSLKRSELCAIVNRINNYQK